jgi:glycosyltransferase involved in cell wall biosynthesis
MVLLIGNSPADQQHSMQRFGAMMLTGLTNAEVHAELIRPAPILGRFKLAGQLIAKWLGYIDKFVLFRPRLKRALAKKPAVIHICDHSNAMYAPRFGNIPVVTTCHDLLAVRGALGEQTECPASATGRILQRWIRRSLGRADVIASISSATAADVERLIICGKARPRHEIVPLGLNYPYRQLALKVALERLSRIDNFNIDLPFVLHVGSNERRKNRDAVVRIFAMCKKKWNGRLVFAGDELNPGTQSLAKELGVSDRITQVQSPNSETLETLYNCALALLYPSRFEGFGWPIIEAQACGCPVICSNTGPLPEAAGEAGLFHDVNDESGFAADLLRLTDPTERQRWSEKSLWNAAGFSAEKMVARYIDIYRSLGAKL